MMNMIYYSRKCQSTFIIERMECENALIKHVNRQTSTVFKDFVFSCSEGVSHFYGIWTVVP